MFNRRLLAYYIGLVAAVLSLWLAVALNAELSHLAYWLYPSSILILLLALVAMERDEFERHIRIRVPNQWQEMPLGSFLGVWDVDQWWKDWVREDRRGFEQEEIEAFKRNHRNLYWFVLIVIFHLLPVMAALAAIEQLA